MEPGILSKPLVLRKGVHHTSNITIAPGGVAMNLTGLKVFANLHGGTPVNPGNTSYSISTDNGLLEVDDPTTGVVTLNFPGANIAGWASGDYIMPVFVTDSDSVVIANGHPLIRFIQVIPSGVYPG